jgi:hypothetical protein
MTARIVPAVRAWLAEAVTMPARHRPRLAKRNLDSAPAELAGTLRAFRAAALWGIAVLIVTAAGAAFAESYRGLWLWAQHHGLAGFWAAAFPLQVDLFVAVGELVLFIAMTDRWGWRDRAGAWAVALLGLAASVAGNVGHVSAHDLQSRGTAAVPPLAAFAALWLGLGVLKRVIARRAETTPAGVPVPVLPEVPTDAEAAAYLALRASTWAGNPLSGRQLEARFGISRAQATRVRDLIAAGMNGHQAADGTSDADQ